MKTLYFCFCALFLGAQLCRGEEMVSEAETKIFFDVYEKTVPGKKDAYKKFQEKHKKTHTPGQPYKLSDVKEAVSGPKQTPIEGSPMVGRTEKNIPKGAITRAEAIALPEKKEQFLKTDEPKPKKPDNLIEVLDNRYDPQPWYYPNEVREVYTFGYDPYTTPDEKIAVEEGIYPKWNRESLVNNIKIRSTWNDLRADEDNLNYDSEKAAKDLVGASFSYAYNAPAESSMWSVNGTLMFPFGWRGNTIPTISSINILPSISLNKVDGSNIPQSKQVDQMIFRAGIAVNSSLLSRETNGKEDDEGASSGGHSDNYNLGLARVKIPNLQLRAAPLIATTTEMNASLPGFEIELEPIMRVFTIDEENGTQPTLLSFGQEQVLIPKLPQELDGSDSFFLKMQLRVWGHMEGGNVARAAANWAQTDGGFLRMGPMGQVVLKFPGAGIFTSASVTATIGYLGSVYGEADNDYYFNLNGSPAFFEDKETGRRVSLLAQYTNGSLLLTGDTVNLFTLGIGVVY